ncbi:MAG: hypothetical protein V1736_10460 [Pseudomonadota bacterium]
MTTSDELIELVLDSVRGDKYPAFDLIQDLSIARQEDPAFFYLSLNFGQGRIIQINRINPQNAKPLGKLTQHFVHDETDWHDRVSSPLSLPGCR